MNGFVHLAKVRLFNIEVEAESEVEIENCTLRNDQKKPNIVKH